MKLEKYAAIDIGSNAVRILIANVISDNCGNVYFHKNSLVRVPIRLGTDTFISGDISKKNTTRLIKAMKAFNLLMNLHDIIDYRAYATSAFREAKNKIHIIKLVKEKTGIEIEVIDGKKEAKLISTQNLFQEINKKSNFLFVDVGGGSTEFSIIKDGNRVIEKSFKIGSVRLLNNLVSNSLWNEVEKWIIKNTKCFDKLSLLGTGGNINKIHKLTNSKEGMPISLVTLSLFYKKISSITYNERIINYQLNPDRADVILPATQIYLRAMQWSKSSSIFVPKIGLSDGMIEELYRLRKE